MTTVGIIANPAAGKDIRRLVAHASPVSDGTKLGIVRRAVLGAAATGVERILLSRDRHALTERAVDGLEIDAEIEILDELAFGDHTDSTAAAQWLYKEDAGAVIVLGGDGTHRDVAAGWLDLPLIPISTGTNNVFPLATDGTVAGIAAAVVAAGVVDLVEVADRMNAIHVTVERVGATVDDHPAEEVALVDVALVAERFVGSRAVWDPDVLREIVACIAEPATVGLSAVAGLLHPSSRGEAGGVHVQLGGDRTLRAPITPGRVAELAIGDVAALAVGDTVDLVAPGVLSFDGERDVVLHEGDIARCMIRQDGPYVIDVDRALELAAAGRFFDGD